MDKKEKKELKNQFLNNKFDKKTKEDYKKAFEDTTEDWAYYKTRKTETKK